MNSFKMKAYIFSVSLLVLLLSSCSKEKGMGNKTYYGALQGELKGLPGTPNLDLYLDDSKLLSMSAGSYFGLNNSQKIAADRPVNMKLRNADNGEVVADTTFLVAREELASFSFAWSEELGIKGFIKSRSVAQDSFAFQVMNKISLQNYPQTDMDLYIVQADPWTLEVLDTMTIITDFRRDELKSQVITLPTKLTPANDPAVLYIGMLKDRKTGEFINHYPVELPLFIFISDPNSYPGSFMICVVSDDLSGYIFTNPIIL
jgi:hypothetical protein